MGHRSIASSAAQRLSFERVRLMMIMMHRAGQLMLLPGQFENDVVLGRGPVFYIDFYINCTDSAAIEEDYNYVSCFDLLLIFARSLARELAKYQLRPFVRYLACYVTDGSLCMFILLLLVPCPKRKNLRQRDHVALQCKSIPRYEGNLQNRDQIRQGSRDRSARIPRTTSAIGRHLDSSSKQTNKN